VSQRYRTIVADPPWHTTAGPRWTGKKGVDAKGAGNPRPLPYKSMTVPEIAALPVADLAEDNAHLYLWTINAHVEAAYTVTWAKTPRGLGLGGAYTSTTEFILFCRRGSLRPTSKIETSWFNWRRPENGTGPMHSRKPEAFIDMVEQVSPGPYVELFARRHRLGWDVWGNEMQNTASLEVSA
jgi:N6-adenosine-specific RNA methylase IME4